MGLEYEELKRLLKLKVTRKQDKACKTLEKWGKRFCVDYGYENAEQVLGDEVERRIKQIERVM